MTIKIYDCYRPQQAVDRFIAGQKTLMTPKQRKEFYPTVDKKNLFRDGYVADAAPVTAGAAPWI